MPAPPRRILPDSPGCATQVNGSCPGPAVIDSMLGGIRKVPHGQIVSAYHCCNVDYCWRVGALPALFSVMTLDAPGAAERPAVLTLVAAMLSFPLACLFAATKAFQRLRVDQLSQACLFLLLPVIILAVAAAAATWIQLFQNGRD